MIKETSLNLPLTVGALPLAVAPRPSLIAAQPNALLISVDDMNDWGIGGHNQAITLRYRLIREAPLSHKCLSAGRN